MRTTEFMKYLFLFAILIVHSIPAKCQPTDVPPAQFDVIITNDGEIIYGKVVEVGLLIIRYKRTDIPDGPVYEIPRNDVYAISYRNQLKEYISPMDSSIFGPPLTHHKHGWKLLPGNYSDYPNSQDSSRWYSSIQNGDIRVGLGSIRNISKVNEVDEYKGEFGLPAFFLSYLFPLGKNLDIGILTGYAKFNYSSSNFNEYDMLMIDKSITESLLSISAVARYSFDAKIFSPYVLGGISFINSNIRSEAKISFTEDGRTVLVQGGGRSGSPGMLIRLGTDISINDNISCYADFGTGLTLLQIGGIYKLRKN